MLNKENSFIQEKMSLFDKGFDMNIQSKNQSEQIILNKENQTIWNILSSFVKEVCKGRDESHGYKHMKKVAKNSIIICYSDYKHEKLFNDILRDVIIVAWLHDVNDHKYDFDGNLPRKVFDFLNQQSFVQSSQKIMDIIERISYSKEVKCRQEKKFHEWEFLLGNYGMIIRDIVSDADKLEALGFEGFFRCISFIEEQYFKKTGEHPSKEIIGQKVKDHSKEKLLRLKDEFIKTIKGKQMAELLHVELIYALVTFL